MNPQLQQILAELRDVHSPPPASWWPPAPGWWLLAALLVVLMVATFWLGYRAIRRRAHRRLAQRTLQRIFAAWQEDGDNRLFLANCAALLRRIALLQWGREEVAKLSGESWRQFLAEHFGNSLSEASLDEICRELYRPQPQTDVQRLRAELATAFKRLRPLRHV